MLTHIIGLELGEKITSVELPLDLDDADMTDVWEGDSIEYTFMVGYHEPVLIHHHCTDLYSSHIQWMQTNVNKANISVMHTVCKTVR